MPPTPLPCFDCGAKPSSPHLHDCVVWGEPMFETRQFVHWARSLRTKDWRGVLLYTENLPSHNVGRNTLLDAGIITYGELVDRGVRGIYNLVGIGPRSRAHLFSHLIERFQDAEFYTVEERIKYLEFQLSEERSRRRRAEEQARRSQ